MLYSVPKNSFLKVTEKDLETSGMANDASLTFTLILNNRGEWGNGERGKTLNAVNTERGDMIVLAPQLKHHAIYSIM